MNYRGSGGYGRAFEQAGYKQWGFKIQNDLIPTALSFWINHTGVPPISGKVKKLENVGVADDAKWAIDQGIVDPQRIVIYGASYGGYPTMAGLVFTPGLYCAGINYVRVTDLNLRAKALDRQAESKRWDSIHVGRTNEDRQALSQNSPANFAERIKVPLLMGYGLNDQRVDVEHGNEMAAALKELGKPFEIVYEKDEGHGFRKVEKYYRTVPTRGRLLEGQFGRRIRQNWNPQSNPFRSSGWNAGDPVVGACKAVSAKKDIGNPHVAENVVG